MADPELDSGFDIDEHGRVSIKYSTFFDLNLDVDDSVEGYVGRILFTLSHAIEEYAISGDWVIRGHPPPPPMPTTNPMASAFCTAFLVVIASLVWIFLSANRLE